MKEGSREEGEATKWDSQRGRVTRTGTNHAVPQKVAVEGWRTRSLGNSLSPATCTFISGVVCSFVDTLTFFSELFDS